MATTVYKLSCQVLKLMIVSIQGKAQLKNSIIANNLFGQKKGVTDLSIAGHCQHSDLSTRISDTCTLMEDISPFSECRTIVGER